MNRIYRLGTRRSALALAQSQRFQKALKREGIASELVTIESAGDRETKTPLYEIEAESPGLFTKQLEHALQDARIELAVHSLKDLPTQQPPGLRVACIPERAVGDDCLVVSEGAGTELYHLKESATIGTSSLRREAELLSHRPDLKVIPIRGNVPTRVRAVLDGKVDAVCLAQAGLQRLGLKTDGLTVIPLPASAFVPAPGQGALAVEVRDDCPRPLLEALSRLHDSWSEKETRIERRILRELHGGCTLPLGVRCQADRSGTGFRIQAFLGLIRPAGAAVREWKSFHRFDISGSDEETLVAQTVGYFRGEMDAG